MRITPALVVLLFVASYSVAQQTPAVAPQQSAPTTPAKTPAPQMKVNFLNVCSPSEAETKEIATALGRIPARPHFATDFEVSRGVSRMSSELLAAGAGAKMDTGTVPLARWVRVRKEFPDQSPFLNAQYSFSVTNDQVSETLVFRARDARELMQVSISDSVVTAEPATVAKSDTAADRVRIERFGKSSLALARCPSGDQSKYEPLFQQASTLLAAYRKALSVRTVVVNDLAKIPISSK